MAALKGLQTLDLDSCKGITDAGLKELAALKGLKTLNLDYRMLTDKALRTLREIDLLHTLTLAEAAVADPPTLRTYSS